MARFGVAGAYLTGAGWSLVAFLLLCTIRATPSASASAEPDTLLDVSSGSAPAQPREGEGSCELLRNREFLGVVGITLIGNICFWGRAQFPTRPELSESCACRQQLAPV